MNKHYKVIWSKVKHSYVVVSELAKSNGKAASTHIQSGRTLGVALSVLALCAGLSGGVSAATPYSSVNDYNGRLVGLDMLAKQGNASGDTAGGIGSTVVGLGTSVKTKTLFQGATATAVGMVNTIDGSTGGEFDGVANAVVGAANTTQNANATLIFGAGNLVTNSYGDVMIDPGALNPTDPISLTKALASAVKDSGGQMLVIGGANIVDNARFSSVTGVNNSLTGTSDNNSQYNFVSGAKNTVTESDNTYLIGTNNAVSGATGNALVGDYRSITGGSNNVILGSGESGKVLDTTVSNAVVAGYNANAAVADGVALGSNSVASVAAGVVGAAPSNTTVSDDDKKTATWTSTLGAVSVGSAGADGKAVGTRQITNVAAGTQDTDAVNVAQLNKVASLINTSSTGSGVEYVSIKGANATDTNKDNKGATELGSIAIGPNASNKGSYSLAVGYGANVVAGGSGQIAIGYNASTLNGSSTIAIGHEATAKDGIAIGYDSYSGTSTSLALGMLSKANKQSSVSVGYMAVSNDNGTALGTYAESYGWDSTALGSYARAYNGKSIASGYQAATYTGRSIALGTNATVYADRSQSLSLEDYEKLSEAEKTKYALDPRTTGEQVETKYNKIGGDTFGTAIGYEAEVFADSGLALGHLAKSYAEAATAIGKFADAGKGDSVALGSKSKVDTEAGAVGYDPNIGRKSTKDTPTWKSTLGTVSVGYKAPYASVKAGTRQITNVAAGTQDTDAVNVAQLKALNTKVDNNATHYFSVNGPTPNGTNYENDGATGANSMAIGPNASASADNAVALGSNVEADIDNAIVIGSNITDGQGIIIGVSSSTTSDDSIAIGVEANASGNARNTAVGWKSKATGDYSVAYGQNSNALGSTSVALGTSVTAKGKAGIAIGNAAVSNVNLEDEGSIAIGDRAKAESDSSIALGTRTVGSGNKSTAIGFFAESKGNYATALGANSAASGRSSVAIGSSAKAEAERSIAIGSSSIANREKGIFGYAPDAATFTSDEELITYLGKADEYNALTEQAQAKEKEMMEKKAAFDANPKDDALYEEALKARDELYAILDERGKLSAAYKSGLGAVSVGNEYVTRQITNVAAGTEDTDAVNVAQLKALNTKVDDGAIHYYSATSDKVADGSNFANDGAKANDSLVIGINSSNIEGAVNSILLGNGTTLEGTKDGKDGSVNGSVVVANGATVNGIYNSVLATDYNNLTDAKITPTTVTGEHNTVLGAGNTVSGDQGITIGALNTVTAAYAIGQGNTVRSKGIAIGSNNKVGQTDEDYGIAVGKDNIVEGKTAIAIGNEVQSMQENSVAIGYQAKSKIAGGVALGAGSVANTDKGVAGYDPTTGTNSTKTTAMWTSKLGAVAVGTPNKTRQITGVAAGWQNTDAVNVAQLKAAKVSVVGGENIASVSTASTPEGGTVYTINAVDKDTTVASGAVTYAADGKGTLTLTDSNGKSIAINGLQNKIEYFSVKSTETGNKDNKGATGLNAVAIGPNAVASGENSVAIGNTNNVSGSGSVVIGYNNRYQNRAIEGSGAVVIGRNTRSSGDSTVIIGDGAGVDPNIVLDGHIAIGKNARVFAGGGEQEAKLGFDPTIWPKGGAGGYDNPTDRSRVATGIAMGVNAKGRTGSIDIGGRTYNGLMGGKQVKGNDAIGFHVNQTALGTNTYAKGLFSTMIGSYSIATGSFDSSGRMNTLAYGAQNFGATVLGSLNSIRSNGSGNFLFPSYEGIANTITGIANITDNTNGSLVYGAGNKISNSVTSINAPTSGAASVDAMVDTLQSAIRNSKSGGATMAFGGGNVADYTQRTAIIGVNNTVKGTDSDISIANAITGFENIATNVSHVTATGSNNVIDSTDNAILLGDNRKLTGINNSVVIGSADTNEEGTKRLESTVADVTVIGHNANASVAGGVALGSGSIATVDKGQLGYDISGNVTDFESALGDNKAAYDAIQNDIKTAQEKATAINTEISTLQEELKQYTFWDDEYSELTQQILAKQQELSETEAIIPAKELEAEKLASTWIATGAAVSVGDADKGITRQITNVAAGTQDTDAVNVAQLKSLGETGLNFKGDTTQILHRGLGEQLNLVGGAQTTDLSDNNIGVVASGEDTLQIKLAKNLKGIDSARIGGTVTPEGVGQGGIYIANQEVTPKITDADGNSTDAPKQTGLYVTGLTNTDWDPDTVGVVNGRAATEDQLQVVANEAKAAATEAGKHTVVSVNGGEKAKNTTYVGTGNLQINVTDADGQKTYDIKLNDKLVLGTKGEPGKPGEDGQPGTDGKAGTPGSIQIIGENGKDAEGKELPEGNNTSADISVKDGAKGLDGKDGVTRIVYKDEDGKPHEVATMDDGLKFAGDDAQPIAKELNEQLDIKGGADTKALSDNNIGVVSETKDGKTYLSVKLAKDLKGIDSARIGGTVTPEGVGQGGIYIANQEVTPKITDADGNSTDAPKQTGLYVTGLTNTDWDPDTVGVVNGRAATEDQLQVVANEAKAAATEAGKHTVVSVNGGEKAKNTTYVGTGNLQINVTDADGQKTYDIKLNDKLVIGTKGEPGKPGEDGQPGTDGKAGTPGSIQIIGENGKDAEGNELPKGNNTSADISVKDGEKGLDGKDGVTRIVYKDEDGKPHEVATMDDGLNFTGDTADVTIPKKLNDTLSIKGGIADETKLSDNNIGVVAKADGGLTIKLAQNINLGSNGSIKFGGGDFIISKTAINFGGATIKNSWGGQIVEGSNDIVNGDTIYKFVKNQFATGGIDIVADDGVIVTRNGSTYKIGLKLNGVDTPTDNTTVEPDKSTTTPGTGTEEPTTPGTGTETPTTPGTGSDTGNTGTDTGNTNTGTADKVSEGKDINISVETKPITVGGDSGTAAATPGSQFNVVGDTNIATVASVVEKDGVKIPQVQVQLNKDLTGLNSVTTGNTTINNDGLTIKGKDGKDGATITSDGIAVKGEDGKDKVVVSRDKVDMGNNRVQGVADAEDDTDAINKGQLDNALNAVGNGMNQMSNRISKLDRRVDRVGAGAAALAALHPLEFSPEAKWEVSAGVGNYKGANAVALGAFYRPNGDTMFSIGTSLGGGENMVNAGVTLRVGDGETENYPARKVMAQQIKDLQSVVDTQNAKIEQLTQLVNTLVGANQQIQPIVSAPQAQADAEEAQPTQQA
ncbi:ESPR-type extended signal peptide-containing protein [Veillonella criceti]|uniref:Adhesin yadA n=1 Tax=Veillonella criceti TaxID=103891 RepID=A0A380NK85_9FIRM|nr:ESPR-type extended signal peptide-containing protein [Veillonella criceti]SUP42727.1 Adhesin yadA precursor [Veillonella criceti]